MTYNEIISNLFVGDMQDAAQFEKDNPEGIIICVLEQRWDAEPIKAIRIPILESTPVSQYSGKAFNSQLNAISDLIIKYLGESKKILVHCAAGIERSPLTVAYHLSRTKGISISDAYKLVFEKRPQAQDRSSWLNSL